MRSGRIPCLRLVEAIEPTDKCCLCKSMASAHSETGCFRDLDIERNPEVSSLPLAATGSPVTAEHGLAEFICP